MSALSMLSLAMPKKKKLFKELVIEYVMDTYKVDKEDMDITDEPVPGFTILARPKREEPKPRLTATGRRCPGAKQEELLRPPDTEEDQLKRNVLIQCIGYREIKIDKKLIDAWILDNDEEDNPPFSRLVLVIADYENDDLIDYVEDISNRRQYYDEFPVSVVFWDEIERFIRRTRSVMRMYYPEFLSFENEVNSNRLSKRGTYKIPDVAAMKRVCIHEMEEYGILRMLQIDPGIGFTVRLLIAADMFAASMKHLEDKSRHLTELETYRRMMAFIITYNKFVEWMSVFCEVDMDTKKVLIIPPYKNEEVEDKLGGLKAEVTDRLNDLFSYWARI